VRQYISWKSARNCVCVFVRQSGKQLTRSELIMCLFSRNLKLHKIVTCNNLKKLTESNWVAYIILVHELVCNRFSTVLKRKLEFIYIHSHSQHRLYIRRTKMSYVTCSSYNSNSKTKKHIKTNIKINWYRKQRVCCQYKIIPSRSDKWFFSKAVFKTLF